MLAGTGLPLFKAQAEDSRVFDLRHYGYEDSWQEGSAGAF